MTYLCYVEAVNLDQLFADCQDLSTTRGGGLSVLHVSEEVAKGLGAELIHGGASQGYLLVEADSGEDARARVRAAIAQGAVMRHTTIPVAVVEYRGGHFDEQRSKLVSAVRWEQMRATTVVYPALAGKAVCEIDNLRPGRKRNDLDGKDVQSDYTAARRQFGREERSLPKRILEGWKEFKTARDLTSIADDWTPKKRWGNLGGKIAVFRFDGNDFGRIARLCRAFEDLNAFTGATRSQQEKVFREMVREQSKLWLHRNSNELRLEIMVYGGDEVTFVTPAWLGWRALRAYYRNWREWTVPIQGDDQRLSYSGGVVFCHAKAPFHAVRKLASDLADELKALAPEREKPWVEAKGNFAAYRVLESFDSVGTDLEKFLKDRKVAIALSPEAIEFIDDNMDLWRATVSRRKLHQLGLRVGKTGAKPVDLGEAVKELLERDAGAKVKKSIEDLYRFFEKAECPDSGLVHMLELWDYAGLGGEEVEE